MNFKRIVRPIICFLLVCTLLIGVSPLRAKAVVPAFALFAAEVVISSILIGLGVHLLSGTDTVEARVISDLTDHLVETTDFIMDGCIKLAYQTSVDNVENDIAKVYADKALVEAIRDWLFDSGTLRTEEVSSYYIAGNSLKSSYVTGSYGTLQSMCLSSTSMASEVFRQLDNYSNVFITDISADYLCGIFWNSQGLLSYSYFDNPTKTLDPGYFGIHALSDLVVSDSGGYCRILTHGLQGQQLSSLSFIFYDRNVSFFNDSSEKKYGYAFPDTKTFTLHSDDPDVQLIEPLFDKPSVYMHRTAIPVDSLVDFGSQRGYFTFGFPLPDNTYCLDEFEWDSAVVSDVVSDSDIELGVVAPQTQSLEVGYSTWYSNSIAITDEETNETVIGLPVPNVGTYEDLSSITQEQVWSGTVTGAGSTTEPVAGSFADTTVKSFLASLTDTLAAPFAALAEAIIAGVQAIFVPTTDFVTAKVDALCANYGFADSIMQTGLALKSGLSGVTTEPPVIYIHLENTEGSYNIGGTVAFLDLTWYAKYKPTVDTLISAFLWICFIWRLIIVLPDIISGASGIPGGSVDIPDNIHTWSGFTYQTKEQYDRNHARFNLNSMKWGRGK